MQNGRLIYLIAGEASGDFIASQLMQALRDLHPSVRMRGVGGPLMAAQGLESLFPMADINLMGLTEIIPQIPHCLRRIRQTVRDIQTQKPDIVITVDAPDFSHRVTKALKKNGSTIPCVHYVAPTVWAWRAGRAARIAQHLDLLLTLFPFEPPYFEKYGLQTRCVGHPLVEVALPPSTADFPGLHTPIYTPPSAVDGDTVGQPDASFLNAPLLPLNANAADTSKAPPATADFPGLRTPNYTPGHNQPSLCVLPGSRLSEVTRLLPLFAEVSLRLKGRFPALTLHLPTLPHLRPAVEALLGPAATHFHITETVEDKWQALQRATAALAASGTVSLELAKTQTPHLIAYRVSPLTYGPLRLLIKTPYVGLVNILLGQLVVPELLQSACNPENLYTHLVELLTSGHTQKPLLAKAYSLLEGPGGLAPSQAAAKAILALMERPR
jgi:lipid-A-disaccharide synthase